MIAQYGLSGTRLPVHPQPLPDELLTHWFMRLAHSNQVKAQTLADWTFGKPSSFWARDQDKLASPVVISRLADITGKNPDDILGLTLASFEGILYQHHNPNGNTRWIMPLGIYHRTRRRYGLQFCPLCLATDPEPYFRRSWRLAFNTVCERHGVLMHDRCHRCGAPVVFFRGELGHRDQHLFDRTARCHACGTDLSRAPAWDPPVGDVHTLIQLRSLATFHEMGWLFCGDETYQYGHIFLDVLHRMCNFLSSAKGKKLLAVASRQSGLMTMEVTRSVRDFESRPTMERHYLLLNALWLLMHWPSRFVQACNQAGVTQSRLLSDWAPPHWFASEVRGSLDRSGYTPTAEEASNAAAYLTHTRQNVSGKSVGRLIGKPDAVAAASYRRQKPRPMTEKEMERFFAGLDEAIRSKPKGSQARLLLERDRTIFWFMRLTGMPQRQVRTITVAEALALAKKGRPTGPGGNKLESVVLSYLQDIRPSLVKDRGNNTLFLAANGSAMCAEALRLRSRFEWNHGITVQKQ